MHEEGVYTRWYPAWIVGGGGGVGSIPRGGYFVGLFTQSLSLFFFQSKSKRRSIEVSTGLFDPDSAVFRLALCITSSCLLLGILCGLVWECLRRKGWVCKVLPVGEYSRNGSVFYYAVQVSLKLDSVRFSMTSSWN